MKLIVLCVGFCLFANATSAAQTMTNTKKIDKKEEFLPAIPKGKKWQLIWSDEFNGTKIDRTKWENRLGKRRDGYWVKEDAYLDGNGNLIIRTKKDGDRYTSGAIQTYRKFEHNFGYWVARCKFHTQQGHWPAFWLRYIPPDKGGYGTEIDIMEKPWPKENKINQALHWDRPGEKLKSRSTKVVMPGLSEGWHTFGLHWKPDEFVFYVDGKESWRISEESFSQAPAFMEFTDEIGKWGGGDIRKAKLPDYFTVDYVRVYDMVDAPEAITQEDIIRKAANVRPSARQLAWQELEFIAFIHFTVNTFTDKEWGDGTEDPAIFNPTQLDTRQWVRICKDAGMKMIILTAKHHDGFCLWPSKYTEHSVKNSPWKNGRGDVVRELADACREAGLKLGLYLSPWDRHEPTYGNTVKYNKFYKNQLRELLTNYGEISEVWFDGAKGKDAKDMVYDWPGYYAIVRKLQPDAVIFNGLDIRWVGNERGYARQSEWSVMNRNDRPFGFINPQQKDLGSLKALGDGENLIWYPAETDVSIRPGWFYHASQDDKVKSLEKLLDIYYISLGRNTVLLLNLPPDRRGLIHENDVQRLRELRKVLDATFKHNLAMGAAAKASCVRGDNPRYGADKIVDGKKDTYWSTDDWTTSATLEFDLGKKYTFNVAELAEYIRIGQRVEEFVLEARHGKTWKEFARGTTIGYKRLLRFDDTTTQKVRIRILKYRVCPTISNFALFYAPPIPTIIRN